MKVHEVEEIIKTKKISAPKDMGLDKILPTEPLLLMGAGPTPIPPAVAQANGVVINHLGDTMNQVIERVKRMGQYLFQTSSDKIFGIAGPSSAGMEMAITNLLWAGRKALICKIGTFSGRFGEMAAAVGADTKILEPEENKPITADLVEKELALDRYDIVTMVQGETSCGILHKDIPEIARLARENGALMVVDAVCTLSTMPLYMDEWGIDVVITGGQKGLSSIPGVSLVAFSKKAWGIAENRQVSCPHWCLDVRRALEFWGYHRYHYTAPVPGILALHEALRLICEETLETRFLRHRMSSLALQAAIESMGLKLFIPKEYRLNSVVAIEIPNQEFGNAVRKYMADTFSVEISGAFGKPIIRIGQMGEQCRSHNLFRTMYAMGMSFKRLGADVNLAKGMATLEENLVEDLDHFVK